MCYFKCHLVKHFAQDCISFSTRKDINTILDSDQVKFSSFNVDSHYQILINDSNKKNVQFCEGDTW